MSTRQLTGNQPSDSVLGHTVTLELHDVSLKAALDEIDRQAKLGLTYTPRVVPVSRRVTIRVKGVTARAALSQVLRGTGVVPVITSAGLVMLVREESAVADTGIRAGIFYGRVTDSTSARVLVGAIVSVQGTTLNSTTNDSGYYVLRNVPVGGHMLVARYLGYQVAEKKAVLVDSAIVRVDFALRLSVARLQQIVTTATGPQRRLEIANDITTINVDSVMQTAPIHSVTELLETRVPGLEVQHTTGTPGAPARIRLRGVSSITRDNNPIVVVDGVRIDIAESRTVNTAPGLRSTSGSFNAPSRLDQIDPNSIATIEVFKGPSAAAMYGSDAANGVIVITTKKGRPGPTHWQVSANHGISKLPGAFPTNLYRFGHSKFGSQSILCPRTQYDCTQDSLVAFQALDDPRYRPFSHGSRSDVTLSASGGGDALTFSFTGSASQDFGILRLPDIEAQRFETFAGRAPPSWMRRPDRLTTWSGSSRITAKLSPKATLTVGSSLTSQSQQQSSLQSAVAAMEGVYVDRTQLGRQPLIADFFARVTNRALDFTSSASLNWHPWEWLPVTVLGGVSLDNVADRNFVPPNILPDVDSTGHLGIGSTRILTRSATISTSFPTRLPLGMRLQTDLGMNLTATAGTTQQGGTAKLTAGVEDPSLFDEDFSQSTRNQTTLGWFLAPRITLSQRLVLSTGFRLDGGSTSGTHATFNGFPKLGLSWVASEEKFFPSALRSVFNTLRLRVAYGHAGVQPGLSDRLRLYTSTAQRFDAAGNPIPNDVRLTTLGNTDLRPERSTELEGGFDADLFDNRISIQYSGYDHLRRDAIIDLPVAPSVNGGGTYKVNIGEVRSRGAELTVGVEALRSALLSWRFDVNFSVNSSKLLRLAADRVGGNIGSVKNNGAPLSALDLGGGRRIVPGYPLFGQWARPVVGWADGLHDGVKDGIIDSTEVILGDSAIYLGQPEPKYQTSLATTIGLFSNHVTVNASFDYQNGATQYNQAGGQGFLNVINDPNASPGTQAAAAVVGLTPYGLIQTVNTLRFRSLSVSVAMPVGVARAFGSRSMFVTVQGSNLGLHTNYRGLDPNVNASVSDGNGDTGQFPQPRTWAFGVRLGN